VQYEWTDTGSNHRYKARKASTFYYDGSWHFLCMAVDRDYSSGIPRLFIDGIEDTAGTTYSSGDATLINVSNSDNTFIGSGSPTPGNYFNGQLDEVKIFNMRFPRTN